jgi:hypothetical protein
VFATWTIYQDHEHLIPDAPELLETFLAAVNFNSKHSLGGNWLTTKIV